MFILPKVDFSFVLLHKENLFLIMHRHLPLSSAFRDADYFSPYSRTYETTRPHMLILSLMYRNLLHLLLTNSVELSLLGAIIRILQHFV
jgi:hypothetical protein